jgi:hypothetical protein
MSLFNEPAPPNPRKHPSRVTQGSLSLSHEAAARPRPQSAAPSRNYMRGTQVCVRVRATQRHTQRERGSVEQSCVAAAGGIPQHSRALPRRGLRRLPLG